MIAGLRGSSGKTFVSLAIVALLRKRGFKVAVFKKGPDFVDSAWLTLASQVPCYTLDTYLADEKAVKNSFLAQMKNADIGIIEANRGLFDGMDAEGSYSSAQLAKLLGVPVVIVLDATKVTRTACAMILGCRVMDPALSIAGVVLNQVAGKRHEAVLRESITKITGVRVLGSIPKTEIKLPERHLGLVMPGEHDSPVDVIEKLVEIAGQRIDLDGIVEVAGQVIAGDKEKEVSKKKVRIGILRDTSFQFYYPENLDELKRQGAELIEINALKEEKLPEVSALYIGGGFPETMADALASNAPFKQSVFSAVEGGMPVWAECGGAMFLGKSVEFEGKRYPMVGVFPVEFGFSRKPQWHGYTELEVDKPNPFFDIGKTIRAHEFHYSFIKESSGIETIFQVKRGYGIDGARDGMIYKNTIALYSHLYDLYGRNGWAKAFVDSACAFERIKTSISNFEVGKITIRESISRAV